MKKFIYLSIALVSLSLISCRNQEDMVQLNDIKPASLAKPSSTESNSTAYGSFDSSAVQQGDPVKPPQD